MKETFQYPMSNVQYPTSKSGGWRSIVGRGCIPGAISIPNPATHARVAHIRSNVVGRGCVPGAARRAFTLIEVLAAMAVLVVLILALTRMFVSAANITGRGLTTIARNSVGETAMDAIMQDLDCMVVNERIACAKIADDVPYVNGGEGAFDSFYFMGTSGDQDDDTPYDYFKYYVRPKLVTNSVGAAYWRYDLMKARMIMAVGANPADGPPFYAMRKEDARWWEKFDAHTEDLQVLAENVVMFDVYCQRWDNGRDFTTDGDDFYSSDVLGATSNIPPVAVDVMLVLASPEAAVEGGMLLAAGQRERGLEVLNRDSSTLIGRAMPMMGATQYRLQRRTDNPVSHYYEK